ncbi:unnamed protein product [Lampetra planeri]
MEQGEDVSSLQPLVDEGWSSSSSPRRLTEMVQHEGSRWMAHLPLPHKRGNRRGSRLHKRPPFCPPRAWRNK